MKARDPTSGFCWILFLHIQCWLVIVGAKPLTITSPTNELWKHVNKTCQLSGDCDEALNLEQLRDIERHIRHDIDPCVDFYQHACGNWAQDPMHQMSTTMMKYGDNMVAQRHVELFRRSLKEPPPEDPILRKMLEYYKICLQTKPTLRDYYQILNWNFSSPWLDTLALLGQYGFAEHYLQLHIKQRNASYHEIQILPHNIHTTVNLDQQVFDILQLHTRRDRLSLRREFQQLEAQLLTIVRNTQADCDDENECDTFRFYSYKQLRRVGPDIDWQRFLTLHLGREPAENDMLLVDALDTIRRLVQHLNGVDPELLALYTLARFLNFLQFHLNLLGHPHPELRCVRHMRKTLYLPMLYIYEQEYYIDRRSQNDQVIGGIFSQLKAQFKLTLARNELNLTPEALQFLNAKLEALRLNLGNLPTNVGPDFYTNYLSTLNVSENFCVNHLQALSHYRTQLLYLSQGGRAIYPAWYTFTYHSADMPDNVDSTAYYYVLNNMIVMPFAYLQTPFYDYKYWPALLYGDLANTLGHEMMHAFDNNFLLYDFAGNVNDMSSQIESNPEFHRRVTTLKTGTEFLSERIADIAGSRLALQTFLQDANFRHSNGKLYFLQFAQFFCGNERNLELLKEEDDQHDINSLRLNYTLAHLPEFAEIFNCAVDSPMNLKQRNIMW